MMNLFITTAIFMGLGATVAYANNRAENKIEKVVMVNDFAPVELKDVPQAVQDAVAKNYEGATIKEAQVKSCAEGNKTYKLVLVNAEQVESTVLFKENGEEIKETAVE